MRLAKRNSRVSNWSKFAAAGVGALAVAVSVAANYEGLRTKAYSDVTGTQTICYGETHGVTPGQTATAAECRAMLATRMARVQTHVRACIHRPMTDGQLSAFDDLAYNIGWPTFCKSSVARKFNAGDVAGACAAIKRYNKAAGKVLPGLVKRRASEYALCIGDTHG